MINSAIKLSILAVPLLLIAGPADSATRKAANARAQMTEPYVHSEMGSEAMAVRAKCWQQALKRPQSADEFRATAGPQSVIYSQCVQSSGYLP